MESRRSMATEIDTARATRLFTQTRSGIGTRSAKLFVAQDADDRGFSGAEKTCKRAACANAEDGLFNCGQGVGWKGRRRTGSCDFKLFNRIVGAARRSTAANGLDI